LDFIKVHGRKDKFYGTNCSNPVKSLLRRTFDRSVILLYKFNVSVVSCVVRWLLYLF
jgi:hypothetical protein